MNMFSSKRGQLNLEKFMINAEKLNNNYFNQKRKIFLKKIRIKNHIQNKNQNII